jgi:hypothetical protein
MEPPLPRKTGILDIVKRLYEQKKKKMMLMNNESSLTNDTVLSIEKQDNIVTTTISDDITQQFSISETTSYESNTIVCDMSIDSPSHSIEEDEIIGELKSKKRDLSPPPSLKLQEYTLNVEECNAIRIDDNTPPPKSLITKRKEDDINRKPKKIGSPIKKRREKKQNKTREQKVIYKPSVYITYKINRKGKKPNHVVYLIDYYMDTKSRVIWIVEDYKNSDKTWNERQDNIICNTLNK